MAAVANSVIDPALAFLKTNANAIHLVDGFDPAVNDRDWIIANTLGSAAVSSLDWTGPGDGPVDGRIITLAALSGTAVASLGAGLGDLGAVLISASEWLYFVNETSEREIVSGEAIDFPSVPVRIRDPA